MPPHISPSVPTPSSAKSSAKRLKFTDLSLQNLKTEGYVWDTLLPAFGLRKGKRRVTFICVRDGRRKKIGLWPATTLSDARKKAREYLASIDPSAPLQPRITYLNAVEEYLRGHQGRLKTVREYERLLKRFPFDATLADIRIQHVLKKTDALEHVPTERLHLHTAYRAFFNWCMPRYLPASPMVGLKNPSKSNKRERVLSYEELKAIWTASKDLGRYGAILQTCILLGLRKGEASKIKPEWLKDGCLVIPASVAKNGREHSLPLGPKAISSVNSVIASQRGYNETSQKTRIDRLSFTANWVVHDARRSVSTHLNDLGVDFRTVESLLNHSLKGVEGVYNRATYMEQRRAALLLWETELEKRGVIS